MVLQNIPWSGPPLGNLDKPRDLHPMFDRSQEWYAPRDGATTIGTASTLVISGNDNRRKITFVNDSDEDIYLGKGNPARSNVGVRLNAHGGSLVDEPDSLGYLYRGPWYAICASGSKVLAWTEDQ